MAQSLIERILYQMQVFIVQGQALNHSRIRLYPSAPFIPNFCDSDTHMYAYQHVLGKDVQQYFERMQRINVSQYNYIFSFFFQGLNVFTDSIVRSNFMLKTQIKASNEELIKAITESNQKMIDQLMAALAKITESIIHMSNTIERMSQKIDGMSQKINRMSQKIQSMSQKIESMSQKIESMSENIVSLENAVAQINRQKSVASSDKESIVLGRHESKYKDPDAIKTIIKKEQKKQ